MLNLEKKFRENNPKSGPEYSEWRGNSFRKLEEGGQPGKSHRNGKEGFVWYESNQLAYYRDCCIVVLIIR